MVFIFYLFIIAFFGRGVLLLCQSKLCCLVSGSYSKIHISSPVMTCLNKFFFFCHFRCVQEGPGTNSFGFPSVHWWEFLGPAWHKLVGQQTSTFFAHLAIVFGLCVLQGCKCDGTVYAGGDWDLNCVLTYLYVTPKVEVHLHSVLCTEPEPIIVDCCYAFVRFSS